MNLALRKPMTLAEFLEWEERQPLRYEFDGVGPVAMAGGSVRHAQIQRNLAFALTARLRGKPCQFLGSDPRTVIYDPVVIFEVSAQAHPRRFTREYQRMPPSALRHARTDASTPRLRPLASWTH